MISSPTRDVGGGTVLLKMADLGLVQVRTLVDETDIGKIEVGPARDGDGGRVSQPAVRGHGAQDRAPGDHRAERHHVPGAGADRQPRGPAHARHERRGGDPRGRARGRARRAQRRAPHPAGRGIGGAGAGALTGDVQQELAAQAPARGAGGAATGAGGQATMGGLRGRAGRRRTPDAPVGRAVPAAPGGGRGRSADPSFGGRYIVFVKRPRRARSRSGSAPASPTSTTARSWTVSRNPIRC